MASIPSHAVFALSLGTWLAPLPERRRVLTLGAILAALPDSDSILHWLGVSSRTMFGHRGLTHSLSFALAAGVLAAWLATRSGALSAVRGRVALYFVVAMVSHGLLDALTNGGQGIAFFAPFSNERYFFPFRPLAVSPIGLHGVFGERGLRIFMSEARWIGVPCALLVGSALLLRPGWSRRGKARIEGAG